MTLQLFEDTRKILKEVKEISGKDVVFKESEELKTYAISKVARSRMSHHIIYYKPIHNEIINYIVAHECGHIIRTFNEKNNRLIPSSDDASRLIAMTEIDKNMKVHFSPDVKSGLYSIWLNGFITQLTSIPEDIRIEKWIFNNYPELRNIQSIALNNQNQDILKGMSPEIQKIIPTFLYNGSSIITYYLLKSLEDLIDPIVLTSMSKSSFYPLAVKIYNEIKENLEKEDSLSNSIAISNYLARELGFDTWFKWIDFENVPDDYETAIAY